MSNPIENAVVKGAGKVAAVEARVKGLKGVFTKLAEQHREAGMLLSRADGTSDVEKRRELWLEIKKALISHERAELSAVYPAIAAHPSTREIAERHAREAGELEQAIKQLDAMTFETTAWQPTLERLTALVKKHVATEENDFFPRALEALGDDAAEQLEQPFLHAQERELKKL